MMADGEKHLSDRRFTFPNSCRRSHPVTSVPTFSPMTTRRRLCGWKKSKTMMGILLSMHSEKAVESITLSCRCKASR